MRGMRSHAKRQDQPRHSYALNVSQTLAILWPLFAGFKGRLSLAILALILAKAATLVMPYQLKLLVDGLNTPEHQSTVLWLSPLLLVLFYGLMRFGSVFFAELRDALFGRITEHAMRSINLRVFKHLHQLELAFHLDRATGGVGRDIERGSNGLAFLMRFLMFNIVPTLLEIALVAVLFWALFSWHYALVTAIAVGVYIGFTVKVTEWRNRFIREANQADSATHTRALDSLLNYETVKYFNNESYEAQAYDQQLAGWERAKLSNRMSLFALNAGQAFIIALTMTLLLWMASRQVQLQQLTVGDITMLNAYLIQLFLPLNFLGFVYREIRRALTDLENMLGLLQRPPQVVDAPGAIDVPAPIVATRAMSLEFRAVHFAYQPERPILKDLNLNIPAGQKIAVVGSSGAGKSTLSRLLYRFYQPQQGQILLNGVDMQQYRLQSVRQLIGVVPQDTVLFNSSIRDNIAYGRPDASAAEIDAAIEQAQLGDFIRQLPDGDATVVGERGLKLSGGEKQRVAIARVLLKNAPIVILDEATSALDSTNEQHILAALARIAQDRTCVVIAHRLSTVVDADQIVVLDDGQVVEQGTHHSLLAQQGRYAAMWRQQSHQPTTDHT